jgi:hypothetical protein
VADWEGGGEREDFGHTLEGNIPSRGSGCCGRVFREWQAGGLVVADPAGGGVREDFEHSWKEIFLLGGERVLLFDYPLGGGEVGEIRRNPLFGTDADLPCLLAKIAGRKKFGGQQGICGDGGMP